MLPPLLTTARSKKGSLLKNPAVTQAGLVPVVVNVEPEKLKDPVFKSTVTVPSA